MGQFSGVPFTGIKNQDKFIWRKSWILKTGRNHNTFDSAVENGCSCLLSRYLQGQKQDDKLGSEISEFRVPTGSDMFGLIKKCSFQRQIFNSRNLCFFLGRLVFLVLTLTIHICICIYNFEYWYFHVHVHHALELGNANYQRVSYDVSPDPFAGYLYLVIPIPQLILNEWYCTAAMPVPTTWTLESNFSKISREKD